MKNLRTGHMESVGVPNKNKMVKCHLKQYLKEVDLTQHEIEQYLGYAAHSLSGIISGEWLPSFEKALKIAALVGKPVELIWENGFRNKDIMHFLRVRAKLLKKLDIIEHEIEEKVVSFNGNGDENDS